MNRRPLQNRDCIDEAIFDEAVYIVDSPMDDAVEDVLGESTVNGIIAEASLRDSFVEIESVIYSFLDDDLWIYET